MTVEVRCCCNPAQLLGWLELAVPQIKEGDVFTFVLDPERPEIGDAEADFWAFGRTAPTKREALTLPVAFWSKKFVDVNGREQLESGLAIKSNDTPMATLRRIKHFRENHDRY